MSACTASRRNPLDANDLLIGKICLYDNPVLKGLLTLAGVKHMLLRKDPGRIFIYVH